MGRAASPFPNHTHTQMYHRFYRWCIPKPPLPRRGTRIQDAAGWWWWWQRYHCQSLFPWYWILGRKPLIQQEFEGQWVEAKHISIILLMATAEDVIVCFHAVPRDMANVSIFTVANPYYAWIFMTEMSRFMLTYRMNRRSDYHVVHAIQQPSCGIRLRWHSYIDSFWALCGDSTM